MILGETKKQFSVTCAVIGTTRRAKNKILLNNDGLLYLFRRCLRVLTKLQRYILAGCFLATFAFFAVDKFWQKAPPHQTVFDTPVASTGAETAEADGGHTPAFKSHRALPETQFPDSYFKLTADSHTDIKATDGNQKIDAVMELTYAHQKTNDGIILTFYSMELKVSQGSALVEDTLMTRDKFVQQAGTQKTQSTFDELRPEMQQALASAFATNLCMIKLDADQNELGREILSDTGFALLKEGNVNTARLMHGPFRRTADRWQCTKRIPMTTGIILDCPVEYSKADANGNEINISGSLGKDKVDSAQGLTMRNVSCSLSGKEHFDESTGDYSSGKMELEYKFQVFRDDTQSATMDGRLELSLERIVSNKK